MKRSHYPVGFSLGEVVVTPAAAAALAAANEHLDCYLYLYQNGVWGDLPHEDVRHNNYAIEFGQGRILGWYLLCTHQNLLITTEPDGSRTTVMLPSEW